MSDLAILAGRTAPANANAYEDLAASAGHVAGRIERYRGSWLLRRRLAGEVESAMVLLSDSLDAAPVFAGEDYEAVCVAPAGRAMPSRFHDRSATTAVPLTRAGELAP